jgi:putative Holliday junction resolvase
MGSTDSAIPAEGRVLGLDWGSGRIGVAITDATQILASPLAVLPRRAGKRLPLGAFLTLVERESPVGLVVGLPLDDEGHLGASAIAAREMGELFAVRSGLPLEWRDESFTTSETLERLHARGIAPRTRRSEVDAMAAAILLERWIAARRGGA